MSLHPDRRLTDTGYWFGTSAAVRLAQSYGCRSIRDLAGRTREEWLSLPKIGPARADDIEGIARMAGLTLGDKVAAKEPPYHYQWKDRARAWYRVTGPDGPVRLGGTRDDDPRDLDNGNIVA